MRGYCAVSGTFKSDKKVMEKFSLFSYTEEEKIRVLKELGFTEKGIQEDVDAIMEWFKMQPHLVEGGIDQELVEKLLLMSKGSREKTKRRIDNFYKHKALSPDLVQSRKELLASDRDFFTFYRHAVTRKKFEDKRITVIQFFDANPSSFSCEEIFRNSFIIGDLRVKYDYMLGEIWLIDLKNVTLSHVLRLNPMVVQRATQMFQEGLALKVFAIHVLNAPSIGQQIVGFFKKFMKPKILDRLIIHSNIEELHKVLPKECLPRDYGGEDHSMEELKVMYQNEFRTEKTKQFLLKGCKEISDEKKRPGANNNEESLEGTFKKLDLD